jgi:hypothetical protein
MIVLTLPSPHQALAVLIAIERTPRKREERKTKEVRNERTKRESIESNPTKRRNIKNVWSQVVAAVVVQAPVQLRLP